MVIGFSIRKQQDGQTVLFDEVANQALLYINSLESQELAAELMLERFDDEGLPIRSDQAL